MAAIKRWAGSSWVRSEGTVSHPVPSPWPGRDTGPPRQVSPRPPEKSTHPNQRWLPETGHPCVLFPVCAAATLNRAHPALNLPRGRKSSNSAACGFESCRDGLQSPLPLSGLSPVGSAFFLVSASLADPGSCTDRPPQAPASLPGGPAQDPLVLSSVVGPGASPSHPVLEPILGQTWCQNTVWGRAGGGSGSQDHTGSEPKIRRKCLRSRNRICQDL